MTPRHCGSCGSALNKEIFCPFCGQSQESFMRMISKKRDWGTRIFILALLIWAIFIAVKHDSLPRAPIHAAEKR